MNIVWFTWKDLGHPLAGGAEVINEALATRLAAAGHSVTFLTGGFSGGSPKLSRHGFEIVRTGSRYTTYLTSAWYFLHNRSALKPDLVIDECNTLPYFAGFYARTRTVLFFHMLCRDIWFYELPRPFSSIGYWLEPLYLRLLQPKSTVITVSQSTQQDLMRCGYPAQNIHIISEATHLVPAPDLTTTTKFDAPTVLVHGSMRPMKRTLEAVQAFELAAALVPNLRLILSGDAASSYGQKVLAYIKQSPQVGSIHYAGRVTEAAKLSLMRRSHAILVTSVKEGWGLIVTEAASQGTPAVVYDVDGLRDSVRPGITGLITAQNTPAALASSVQALLADPVMYQKYRQAGWEWAKTLTFDRTYHEFIQAMHIPL